MLCEYTDPLVCSNPTLATGRQPLCYCFQQRTPTVSFRSVPTTAESSPIAKCYKGPLQQGHANDLNQGMRASHIYTAPNLLLVKILRITRHDLLRTRPLNSFSPLHCNRTTTHRNPASSRSSTAT